LVIFVRIIHFVAQMKGSGSVKTIDHGAQWCPQSIMMPIAVTAPHIETEMQSTKGGSQWRPASEL
jgi:hypothetical protein